ncbi:TPA: YpfB family protein [Bacillus paranthracis]|uniref:YpfB family protein n=1 Tax=Bacillus TaxID=1386 RepID=UPI00142F0BB3|nr:MULTISPECIES: YpfB family protein [Bacillus]MDA1586359.1 YpfB family protein [Bacillus cereus group sp. TH230-1LC]MED0974762.1 YpfB family protein [Bacillus paranthracis]MED1138492.1 YpfB family protein [Bacillus paranthracis]
MKKVETILIRILLIQFICLSVVQLLFIHKSSVKYLSKIVYYEGVMVKNKVEILQVNR